MRRVSRPPVLFRGRPVARTVLLLHCDGTNGSTTIVDSSPDARVPYDISGASISTAQSVFGGASLYVTGAAGIRYADDDAFSLGTKDFELSFWIRPASGSSDKYVFGHYNGVNNAGHSIGVRLTNLAISYSASSGPSPLVNITSSVNLTLNAWSFCAFTRVGNTFTVFQGSAPGGPASVVGSVTTSGAINDSPGRLGVGRLGDYSAANVNAYLDEICFRIGAAAQFSLCPSAPF